MKNLKTFLILFFAASSTFIFSCRGNEKIEFNKADLEALDIEFQWAVVNVPYVACRENPSYDSKVVKNLRKNMLEKIVGEKTVKIVDGESEKYEKWLAFEYGWVPESAVNVYLNKMRAENAIKSE
ncbi:MAG: hypothetical protein IKP49_09725 [Treponema sp.]|nr:hypothetical protein [Treponema sp.]